MNLATLDPIIREKSIVSFAGELERAKAIGAEYLVLHPGNYRGQTAAEGIAAFVLGMAEAAQTVDCPGLTVLIENTVGAGCQIGSTFLELRMIRDLAQGETSLPIGYCLDTCHMFAAGFNIATPRGLQETLSQAGEVLGLEHVHVIHANDSRGMLGSRLDRHANIGEGQIGEDGFRGILTHPALRTKAFILETPVDEEGDDLRNVNTLKRLSQITKKRKSELTNA